MKIIQREIVLQPFTRGFHLITDEIMRQIPEIREISKGTLQVFVKHTSASLTINENADPTVRVDFESWFNSAVREDFPSFIHTYEGADDMPAHIKSSLLGSSVNLPITDGRPNLGTWQGIYLCEHRNRGGSRKLVITAMGQ
ncbi:MAG: secondary thiamine-phosphate synthase enzyme YjbQ [Cyclobacteriaceae bacterium]